MTKWEVYSNYFSNSMQYIVGRKLRENEPWHSGNVEYRGGYGTDRDEKQRLADSLNEQIDKGDTSNG